MKNFSIFDRGIYTEHRRRYYFDGCKIIFTTLPYDTKPSYGSRASVLWTTGSVFYRIERSCPIFRALNLEIFPRYNDDTLLCDGVRFALARSRNPEKTGAESGGESSLLTVIILNGIVRK